MCWMTKKVVLCLNPRRVRRGPRRHLASNERVRRCWMICPARRGPSSFLSSRKKQVVRLHRKKERRSVVAAVERKRHTERNSVATDDSNTSQQKVMVKGDCHHCNAAVTHLCGRYEVSGQYVHKNVSIKRIGYKTEVYVNSKRRNGRGIACTLCWAAASCQASACGVWGARQGGYKFSHAHKLILSHEHHSTRTETGLRL